MINWMQFYMELLEFLSLQVFKQLINVHYDTPASNHKTLIISLVSKSFDKPDS